MHTRIIIDKKDDSLDKSIKKYKHAIAKYNNINWYRRIQVTTSVIVISLQLATTLQLFYLFHSVNIFKIIFTIGIAYAFTDLINGFIHMIMDNSTNYSSIIGPFVAAFHLHHQKITYKHNSSVKVYFYESGQKYWLVFYLIFLLIGQCCFKLNIYVNLTLVLIGVLSSVAELSHFWCHNFQKNSVLIRLLQKYGILLSMKHHRIHHSRDNVNYAFLNGMTDPLLNQIANFFCKGYKNRADIHVSKNL